MFPSQRVSAQVHRNPERQLARVTSSPQPARTCILPTPAHKRAFLSGEPAEGHSVRARLLLRRGGGAAPRTPARMWGDAEAPPVGAGLAGVPRGLAFEALMTKRPARTRCSSRGLASAWFPSPHDAFAAGPRSRAGRATARARRGPGGGERCSRTPSNRDSCPSCTALAASPFRSGTSRSAMATSSASPTR